eukprot:4481574-Alexandrium_andersonii.AAC.1
MGQAGSNRQMVSARVVVNKQVVRDILEPASGVHGFTFSTCHFGQQELIDAEMAETEIVWVPGKNQSMAVARGYADK